MADNSRGEIAQSDYQRILLPDGTATSGHDRSATANLIFESDLANKSVLDVGCSLGFFCFEAEKRGAQNVVGIDVHRDAIEKARSIAEISGSRVKFIEGDLEHAELPQRFDHVLCLNVLHHLHEPLRTLNMLIDLTNEVLVLEVASFGSHDKKKVRLPGWICWLLSRLPLIFVTPTGTRGDREVQRFYMSVGAIRNLLLAHRGVFAHLETKASPHKGRFIIVAHKRRIDHLLVVAGPTSSGKKTFERQLLENQLPEINNLIGEPDGRVWGDVVSANHIDKPSPAVRSHVLLHYDILRPFLRSTRVYERDEALEFFQCATKVTVVTMQTEAPKLARQIDQAEIKPREKSGRKPKKRHLRIRDLYHDENKVEEVYNSWIEFVGKHKATHWLVSAGENRQYLAVPAVL
jgi:SAM-dependent methyltransferase